MQVYEKLITESAKNNAHLAAACYNVDTEGIVSITDFMIGPGVW